MWKQQCNISFWNQHRDKKPRSSPKILSTSIFHVDFWSRKNQWGEMREVCGVFYRPPFRSSSKIFNPRLFRHKESLSNCCGRVPWRGAPSRSSRPGGRRRPCCPAPRSSSTVPRTHWRWGAKCPLRFYSFFNHSRYIIQRGSHIRGSDFIHKISVPSFICCFCWLFCAFILFRVAGLQATKWGRAIAHFQTFF